MRVHASGHEDGGSRDGAGIGLLALEGAGLLVVGAIGAVGRGTEIVCRPAADGDVLDGAQDGVGGLLAATVFGRARGGAGG